jgi:hypothetical protein
MLRRLAVAVTRARVGEGTLWVRRYQNRKIHQADPETGAVLRTIESNRFVTGVTWVDGELWHATWEGEESDLRRVDPQTGEVLESLEMLRRVNVSGLESDGGDQFFCRGGASGKVRALGRTRLLRPIAHAFRIGPCPMVLRRFDRTETLVAKEPMRNPSLRGN